MLYIWYLSNFSMLNQIKYSIWLQKNKDNMDMKTKPMAVGPAIWICILVYVQEAGHTELVLKYY